MTNPKNSNCTISDNSPCTQCRIKGDLECRFNRKSLHAFMKIGFPPAAATLAGLILSGIFTGQWWMLITYAVFTFGMLGAVEMLFLCRHCPYYALEGKTIVCIGNYGSLKLLPYSPYPMNGLERFLMVAFLFLSFLILPMGGMINTLRLVGGGFSSSHFILFALMTAIVLFFCIFFIVKLVTGVCKKCVNFSCPFNRVPKDVVDQYLLLNRTMREAWEERGYKIG